jgi:hypothetical protein
MVRSRVAAHNVRVICQVLCRSQIPFAKCSSSCGTCTHSIGPLARATALAIVPLARRSESRAAAHAAGTVYSIPTLIGLSGSESLSRRRWHGTVTGANSDWPEALTMVPGPSMQPRAQSPRPGARSCSTDSAWDSRARDASQCMRTG